MKLKLFVTLFLALLFGISGMSESEITLQQLWFGLMVLNLGLIYKWILEYNLKGKRIIEVKSHSTAKNYIEEARN